jgi:outer membrane protein assembly factor BamB
VALDPKIVQSGIIAIAFAACSVRNDRAILTYGYAGRGSQFWLIRISDGTILSHRSFPADQLANISASFDGTVVAENSGRSSGQIATAAPSTIIRRASDMAVVATLSPTIDVLGFNSDGSLALVTTTPWVSGIATHLAAINVQTGEMLWRSDGTEEYAGFLAQPGGADLAVMLKDPNDSSVHAPVNVVIVHSDGTAISILSRFGHI